MTTQNTSDFLKRLSDEELRALPEDPAALRAAYECSHVLQQEFLDFGCFSAYLKSWKNGQPARISSEEMLLLGDDPEAWRMAYERSRELQQEFLDFGRFSAYLKSWKNGKSRVCGGGTVTSREVDNPKEKHLAT